MRLTLLHNPTSGNEDHSRELLVSLLVEAGHDVHYRSLKEEGWSEALSVPRDVIVIAGGDGSVQKVLTALRDSATTATLLPTGSANNIARTLGFTTDDPARLLSGWEPAARQPFDVWDVQAGSERRTFAESFGGGIFAEVLRRAEHEHDRGGDDKVDRGLELIREVLTTAEPVEWVLNVNGEPIREQLLGFEAMNVRELGPNLLLSPGGAAGDGAIELVLIRPDDRAALLDYAARKLEDEHTDPPLLSSHRASEMRVRPVPGGRLHVDDELAFENAVDEVTIRRAPARIEVLVPAFPDPIL